MCTGGIAWCEFNWEAFATLTTGILAVGSAVFVGSRQTKILARQTNIQEATLRSDLFDRRYKVFEKAEQFIREILQSGDDPSPETQREFIVASGESRFLFPPTVKEGLEEIWSQWTAFHALKGNPERERLAFGWFAERFKTLPELFDDLKLGARPFG